MNRVFKLNSNSRNSLRQILKFFRFLIKSVYHGTESIFYLGPKIWDMLPDDYKTIQNLDTFKIKVEKWKTENCSRRYVKFILIEQVFF